MVKIGKLGIGIGIALGIFSGYKAVSNLNTYLSVDKKVEKVLDLAGGTVSLKKHENIQSMEGLLEEALENSKKWKGENSAILFKTELYEMDNLIQLLDDARKHAHEVGILDEAYKTGKLADDAPGWVKLTYENCVPDAEESLRYKRLFSSELASTIASVYEAFNDAVSGGVNAKGDKVQQKNMALVDQMSKASNYAFWSPFDVDFKPMNNAWAYTYFALIYSDMGKLDKSINYLNKAKNILDNYSDGVDLTIVRSNIKTLEIGTLKQAINSGIYEFTALNNMDPELKYTSGWWGQVQKKSESLGASNVFIGDIAERYGGIYGRAAALWLIPLLLGIGVGFKGYTDESSSWM